MLATRLIVRFSNQLTVGQPDNKTEHVVKWSGYTNQVALERHLKELAKEAPHVASTFSLGQSEQVIYLGKPLGTISAVQIDF